MCSFIADIIWCPSRTTALRRVRYCSRSSDLIRIYTAGAQCPAVARQRGSLPVVREVVRQKRPRSKGVRRSSVMGVNAPLPPRRKFCENVTTKRCILKYI